MIPLSVGKDGVLTELPSRQKPWGGRQPAPTWEGLGGEKMVASDGGADDHVINTSKQIGMKREGYSGPSLDSGSDRIGFGLTDKLASCSAI